MQLTYKILLRDNYTSKNGEKQIILRIVKNSKKKDIGLGVSVLPANFDTVKTTVSKKDPQHITKNDLLFHYKNKCSHFIHNAIMSENEISIIEFCEAFKNTASVDSFSDFILDFIQRNKYKLARETVRTYNSQITKLLQFCANIPFNDVNEDFIRRYEKYMYQRGNNKVTVAKSLSHLRLYTNEALKQNKLVKNPFDNIKIKQGIGNREFLDITEVNRLYNFYLNSCRLSSVPAKYFNVVQYFLFCCFTGLRYSDIKQLEYSHIDNNIVKIKMHKTGSYVSIPMSKQAVLLLPPKKNEFNKICFKVLSNQKTNEHLKEISKYVGIKKTVSFHCSRHTFATVSIGLNIPIEIIQNILGHTDIRTTQIYSKIVNDVKSKYIENWNTI